MIFNQDFKALKELCDLLKNNLKMYLLKNNLGFTIKYVFMLKFGIYHTE